MKNHLSVGQLRLVVFAFVPAWIVGMLIMRLYSAPMVMPLMNLGAGIIGFVGVLFGARGLSSAIAKTPFPFALAILGIITFTLFDRGLDGVHRWLQLGPVRLHAAALTTPILLFALARLWLEQKTVLVLGLVAASLALHIMQPDAGQATALGAATMILAIFPDKRHVARGTLVLVATAGIAGAWVRPDPLASVPMVEGIVAEAFVLHVALGLVACVALVLLPAMALRTAHQYRTNHFVWLFGTLLAAYFSVSIAVAAVGAFPVPVLGFGASPILGALLGLGLLQSSAPREPSPSRS